LHLTWTGAEKQRTAIGEMRGLQDYPH
jgi:hypothetical protein